ncbi:Uncharacterised protein r2_g2732 [Pycnogonum litorale]
MELSGIPQPVFDWESSNLPDAFKRFAEHVRLIFDGPLREKEEEVKCTYLMLWIGDKGREIFSTWQVSEEDRKKLSTYFDRFQAYVQPHRKT